MKQVIELTERRRGTRCCAPVAAGLSMDVAEAVTADLQILANPIRLRILDLLARNPVPVCVCDVEAAVPVKQPTVSHHLRLLREAGLIAATKQGLWVYYTIRREAMAALQARVAGYLAPLAGDAEEPTWTR